METNIINLIPFGKESAITRYSLRNKLGTDDRTMRMMIETARNEGAIIINRQDGKGYYQTDDISEIKRQFKQNRSRAMSILKHQKHLYQKLKASGEIVSWNEV